MEGSEAKIGEPGFYNQGQGCKTWFGSKAEIKNICFSAWDKDIKLGQETK